MNKETSAHLNHEALVRWQMGDATDSQRRHVAECPECQAQAEPLKDALSWFGTAARQWGEERSALAQEWRESKGAAAQEWRESKGAAAQEWRESKAAMTWSWRGMAATWAVVSVALLLIFGLGLPRWKAHRSAMEATVQHQQQLQAHQPQEAQQALARDNALLEAVDQDVSQVVPEAMEPLSWNTANSSTASAIGTASRQ